MSTLRPKVLLVEDQSALQMTLQSFLEKQYQVVTVRTIAEATEHIKDKTYFIAILVDLNLPDGSGLDIIKLAKEKAEKSAILVLTGDNKADTVQEAINSGANDYIVKPIYQKELLERMKKTLTKLGLT